ncbi:deoxyhypusine synthase [Elysia marginata]|uniref:Deoxyhypusine synthase n=1 Tax=Elysia marginata TaxID=1093978 RepID=A0AAV4H2M9_9GAST|nr:deoxyhypusine synthase [Elysia marginata]
MVHGKCKFNPAWLLEPEYSSWLEEVPNDVHRAMCSLCKKSFDISNKSRGNLDSHMKSATHIERKNLKKTNSSLISFFGKASTATKRAFIAPMTAGSPASASSSTLQSSESTPICVLTHQEDEPTAPVCPATEVQDAVTELPKSTSVQPTV